MARELPYSDSIEELKRVQELFQKESIAEREEFSRKMDSVSIKDRIQNGVTIHPLEVDEINFFIGDSWKIYLIPKNPLPKFHSFSPGTPISLFRGEDRKFGQISNVHQDKITVIMEGEIPDWLEEGKIGIDLFYSEKSYKEGDRALNRIQEDKANRKNLRELLLGYKSSPPDFLDWKYINLEIDSGFNSSQKSAIQSILTTSDSLVIQGPPGTGKTSVLVEAIRLLVLTGKKVLVSTPTNSALDLLLEKMLPLEIQPIRIGQTSRVSEKLLTHTIDSLVDKHKLTKTINKYQKQAANLRKKATRFHRNFGPKQKEERNQSWIDYKGIQETIRNTERQIEKELVSLHNPVLATNVSASQAILNRVDFDICILDEATQSLEPTAWIPILRAKVVVFAGDENQLPPTLLSEDKSLLETLFLKVTNVFRGTKRFSFLNTQYRMEKEILGFSNQEFYGGLVETDQSVLDRPKIHKPLFDSPMVFIDTAGTGFEEERSQESESTKNSGEAGIVFNIASKLMDELKISQESIGIIAPYKEQVYCIREKFGNGMDKIEISTVDSFQGREKDIIILSMTRSNEEGEIGFLKDYRRMNVSLTRARKILVAIGDSVTLSNDSFYSRFLEYAKKSGDYRSAYEFMDSE